VEVSISGGGRVSVGRYGAASGVTVGLGTAVAMRARFSLRPNTEQEARRTHNPNPGKKRIDDRLERAGKSSIAGSRIDSNCSKNPARP